MSTLIHVAAATVRLRAVRDVVDGPGDTGVPVAPRATVARALLVVIKQITRWAFLGEYVHDPALDAAVWVLWVSGTWRPVSEDMAIGPREAAARAIERHHSRRFPGELPAEREVRWWLSEDSAQQFKEER